MKINFKSLSLGLIIGVAITSGVAYAATLINSSDVTYSPEEPILPGPEKDSSDYF